MKVSPTVREAPYSAALAQEAGWRLVIAELEVILTERDLFASDSEGTLYINFEFMDGRPVMMGISGEPAVTVPDFPNRYNSNIYEVLEDELCPTLANHPMHHAMFRYKDKSWQAARVFDSYKETWNRWRATRADFKSNREQWFTQFVSDGFELVHHIDLYIPIDPETTEQKILPLLVGVGSKTVWMMSNGFSDRLNPYSGENWAELPTCNAELLYQCARAQIGDAVNTVEELTKSPEVAAITQVAEAFYWRYIDGLEKRTENPDVEFSKPQRLQTVSEHTSSSQALETDTTFLLSRYKKKGDIVLFDGREVTPALVTIEGGLSSKLSPPVAAMLKNTIGGLGKAPGKFSGPSEEDLLTLLREEIAIHGSIQSKLLEQRMQYFAALEFHHGRYLPEDLAPHLDYLYFVEFGAASLSFHRRQAQEYGDFDTQLLEEQPQNQPALEDLKVYKCLRELDLRCSELADLDWFRSVDWLEVLLLNSTTLRDFSPLAHAPRLKRLSLSQTKLNDLAPLTTLNKLETLELHSVQINDISPLSSMTTLKKLNLSNMPINDISCLGSLHNLEELLLAGIDDIKDYSVLSRLPNLKLLSIAETMIDDLSLLPDMPKLETLYLWDCIKIKDLSPLERYKNLKPVNTRGTAV